MFVVAMLLFSVPQTMLAAGQISVYGVADYRWQDTLKNDDAFIFRDKLLNEGWTVNHQAYDEDVWSTFFHNQGNNSDMLFFTGHGFRTVDSKGNFDYSGLALYEHTFDQEQIEQVVIPYRNLVYPGNIGGDNIWDGDDSALGKDFEWAVFMSCFSLEDKRWGYTLENKGHHLFGYWDVSSEWTDHKVVDYFLDLSLGNGYSAQTLVSSWINANKVYDEDNWTVIGHEKNRMDYMHFVKDGATPDVYGLSDLVKYLPSGKWYLNLQSKDASKMEKTELDKHINDNNFKIKVKNEKLDEKEIRDNLIGKDYTKEQTNESITYQKENANLTFYKDNSLIFTNEVGTKPLRKTKDEVLKEITDFIKLNGGLPADAVVDEIIEEKRENQDGTEEIYSYTVKYKQKVGDIKIDGNYGNGIKISYDSNGVSFYLRNLKQVETKEKLKNKDVSISKIKEKAKELSKEHFKTKQDLTIEGIEYVLNAGNFEDKKAELTPSWKVHFKGGSSLILNEEGL